MSELKKGDRVIVKMSRDDPAFNGEIVGEGRSGHWWIVLKDGTKTSQGYHKNFCRPENQELPT
jgi:hypothetical protein